MPIRRRKPLPYLGTAGADRDRILREIVEKRRGARAAAKPPELRYERPPPKPRQASYNDYQQGTQFRIHAFNVANFVRQNSEAFPEELVGKAEELCEKAKPIGLRRREGTHLLDGGEPIWMIGGDEFAEDTAKRQEWGEIAGFVSKARAEVRAAISKGHSLRLRQIVDFWDPGQRKKLDGYVREHFAMLDDFSKRMQFGATSEKTDLLRLLSFFGPNMPKTIQVGEHFELNRAEPSLEDYRKGAAGLEGLQRIVKSSPGLFLSGHKEADAETKKQLELFDSSYRLLKKALIARVL